MIETYDVKASIRESDKIWNEFNKLQVSKQTGGLGKNELSDLLVNIGDVFANLVKKGKVNDDGIESYKNHLSQFLGEDSDKYFLFPHEGLEHATKTSFESIEFAKDEAEKRFQYAQPVREAESYERTFRRLG